MKISRRLTFNAEKHGGSVHKELNMDIMEKGQEGKVGQVVAMSDGENMHGEKLEGQAAMMLEEAESIAKPGKEDEVGTSELG